MSISSEISKLKNQDLYSILLFTLFQCRNTNEYSALSELAYILDEKNLLSLCEYFGGMTITIPKIEELELLLCGLEMYKDTHIDKLTLEESILKCKNKRFKTSDIKEVYVTITEVMSNFSFGDSNND